MPAPLPPPSQTSCPSRYKPQSCRSYRPKYLHGWTTSNARRNFPTNISTSFPKYLLLSHGYCTTRSPSSGNSCVARDSVSLSISGISPLTRDFPWLRNQTMATSCKIPESTLGYVVLVRDDIYQCAPQPPSRARLNHKWHVTYTCRFLFFL